MTEQGTTWTRTLLLRWVETSNYIPQIDNFEMILQQCWISDKGELEWREIEIVKVK